jgi:predicted transcriptional regulator of viral defense system
MPPLNIVHTLFDKNHGYLTTRMAQANGIQRWELSRLLDQGMIARPAQGLYVKADLLPDPFVVAQHRCSKGVFSHETALYFHGLSDRVPLQMMMTIPSGWNCALLKDPDMMFFYCRTAWFELGLAHAQTEAGLQVRCYDMERTICDCVRSIDRLDRDIVISAVKGYMQKKQSDKAKLLAFAQTFGIRDTMYQYMEVL